jgi:Putative DNA-binding domain
VPTLLELQRAMRASLIDHDDGPAAAMLAESVPADRLNVYRNTFVTGVTKALRLSYPAVHRLVGNNFFEGVAGLFIAQHPPRAAYLDEYGADFPQFLRGFQPAASLAYLPDVARLEWAVNRAIHAVDVEPLDLSRLETLPSEDQVRVCFVPHPSIALLRADYPVDLIWRGVLGGDDAALAAIDLKAGPVRLLVERRATGVEVSRLNAAAWSFAVALCDGRPLAEVFAKCPHPTVPGEQGRVGWGWEVQLAEHLAAGRFIDFHLAPCEVTALAAASEAVR